MHIKKYSAHFYVQKIFDSLFLVCWYILINVELNIKINKLTQN